MELMDQRKRMLKSKNNQEVKRKEKKAIQKLGMKLMTEITRVTIKKSKTVMFVVAKPEVYKGTGDTYVIFGEAKMEDISGKQQAAAAQSISQEPPKPVKKEAVSKKRRRRRSQ